MVAARQSGGQQEATMCRMCSTRATASSNQCEETGRVERAQR